MTSVVFALCIDLALKRGHRDIQGQVVVIAFGGIWKLTINAKRQHVELLPPFHALIECNGLPVTILGPEGGGPIIGASENELIEALKAAGAELPPDEPPAPDPQQRLPGVEDHKEQTK